MRVRILEVEMGQSTKIYARKLLAYAAAAALLSGGAIVAAAPVKSGWLLTFAVSDKGGHIVGNPNAPTKLVEYASYTCGFCAKFESNEVPGLKSQYVASGKVSFEIRNLVRDAMDLTAAMAARCGGKGRFFGNHRHLMATQATWADDSKISDATIAKLEADDLPGYLQASYTELGLDKVMAARGIGAAQGKVCMADAAGLKAVLDMTDEAGTFGINGTPSFMINGKVVDAHDLATLAPLFTLQ